MDKCNICPRKCNVNRDTQKGFCLCGNKTTVSKYMLHYWEEPPISGTNGSGAVFFSGCNLKCVFCQNREISREPKGKLYDTQDLARLFLELQSMGAHNLNLVTPTHFADNVLKALDKVKDKLNIPVVYNTSGYESVETLKLFSGYVDIYLPDFKYYDSGLSAKYSKAPDYFETASKALKEMYRQCGQYTEDEKGLAKKGIIVRHLVLPGCRRDSVKILEELQNILPVQDIRLSLMSQFTPDFVPKEYKELSRRITTFEYNFVLDKAIEMGYEGFFQRYYART